jgi:hypothetical protein
VAAVAAVNLLPVAVEDVLTDVDAGVGVRHIHYR